MSTTSKTEKKSRPAKKPMGRPPREELSALELRGIRALIEQRTIVAAAAAIGVHPRTLSRWLRTPTFRTEFLAQLGEMQLAGWQDMHGLREEARDRFRQLLRSKDERIALRACCWLFERLLAPPPMALIQQDAGRASAVPTELHSLLRSIASAPAPEEEIIDVG